MRFKIGNIIIQCDDLEYSIFEYESGISITGLNEIEVLEKLNLFINDYRQGKGLLKIQDENYVDKRYLEFLFLNCNYETFTINQYYALKEIFIQMNLTTQYYSPLFLKKLHKINLNIEDIYCGYDLLAYQKMEMIIYELLFEKVNPKTQTTKEIKEILQLCLNEKDSESKISIAKDTEKNNVILAMVNKEITVESITVNQLYDYIHNANCLFEIKLNNEKYIIFDNIYALNIKSIDYAIPRYNHKSDLQDWNAITIKGHHFYYRKRDEKIIFKYGSYQKEMYIVFDEMIQGVVIENEIIYCASLENIKYYFHHIEQENIYFALYFMQKIFDKQLLYIHQKIKKYTKQNNKFEKLLDNLINFLLYHHIQHDKKTMHEFNIEFEKLEENLMEE